MTFPKQALPSSRQATAQAAPAPARDHRSVRMWLLGTGLALGTGLVLLATGAQAQSVAAAPAEPKYTVTQIAQAFAYIDGNKDGKLSREEAAGFRGVARHFDEADTNRDGALSREEFENALSGDKNR
jgi:hypothetical protein